MKAFRSLLQVAAVSVAVLGVQGKEADKKVPSVDEIVKKANLTAYYQGKDGRAEVQMLIRDSQGRIRTRQFFIFRRDQEEGGEQKFYVYFTRPSDVRGMVFMVWKHLNKDDDRWLYLPSLDLVKRIAASDKRTSFVGSHYYYEDVSGRGIYEDKHELVKVTDKFYVLKHTPKDPASVEFSYYLTWIDKKTFMPMRADYYDKQGKLHRRIAALEVKNIQGYPTVTKAVAEDFRTKGKTMIRFRDIKYDIGVPENLFTERYLRRKPPASLLK